MSCRHYTELSVYKSFVQVTWNMIYLFCAKCCQKLLRLLKNFHRGQSVKLPPGYVSMLHNHNRKPVQKISLSGFWKEDFYKWKSKSNIRLLRHIQNVPPCFKDFILIFCFNDWYCAKFHLKVWNYYIF